jgi:GNAT superfamily N-acetyltransferase
MCATEDVRQALADAQRQPKARGDATPGKIARLMNQGKDDVVRRLLEAEYEVDRSTANRLVEQLQGKVDAKALSTRQRDKVVASARIEDQGHCFTIRFVEAGDTWLQASYTEIHQRLFVVSMAVPARYRRNGLSTALLAATIRYAEQTRGPVNSVKGEAGGTNYRVLHTQDLGIADTPFAKALSGLGFDTTYAVATNEMLATRRQV